MADMDKATATQLANLEERTGKPLDELKAIVRASGLSRHGEMVTMLKTTLGMGHGDANLLVHVVRKASETGPGSGEGATLREVLGGLYVGKKEALRPIHDRVQKELDRWGGHEWVPKKTYVSYRRKKQFATVGPATNTQVEIGLNAKELEPTERLQALPAGQMCNYRVRVGSEGDVDAELLGWLRHAWEAST